MNFKANLKFLIIIDEITEEAREKAAESNVKLFSFKEILELGKSELAEPVVS